MDCANVRIAKHYLKQTHSKITRLIINSFGVHQNNLNPYKLSCINEHEIWIYKEKIFLIIAFIAVLCI